MTPLFDHFHHEHTPVHSSLQTCVLWLQHVLDFVGLADAVIVDGATRDLDSSFAPSSIRPDPRTPLHPSHGSEHS